AARAPGLPEQVTEVKRLAAPAGEAAGPAEAAGEAGATPAGEQPAGLVVLRPPLVVGQHVVGLGDLLEPGLGLRVVRVLVRVQVAGQLAVGLLDGRRVGVLRNAQRGVVVLLDEVPSAHRAPPLVLSRTTARRRAPGRRRPEPPGPRGR